MTSLKTLIAAALALISCGGASVALTPPAAPPAVQCPPPAASVPVAPLLAEPVGFEAMAAAQSSANAKPGARHVPARDIPVPSADVSPQVQEMIGGPYGSQWDHHPKNAAEWKAFAAKFVAWGEKNVPPLAAKLHVTVTPTTIAGVPCFIVAPESIPPRNRNRLLVHVHGGAYVFGRGISGTSEAVLLAGFGGFKVIAIDYRVAPDFPYPAALDDAMAVWKQEVTTVKPRNMAIFGSSAGGALTLAMVLRAKNEHLPLPAAIAAGSPWSDLTDTGDSYHTNEWLDRTLVSMNGMPVDAARLYAAGHDLKEPYLSPVYGDFHGFPPAVLTTGTRDLGLSNTVRVHRKLRRAGVEAELHVYEGQSHCDFLDFDAPETQEAMTEIATFFERHLGA